MKLILREDVDKLGKIGDLVNVSEGYGRNFLLPRNLAMFATEGTLKVIEKEKQAKTRKEEKIKNEVKQLASKLASKSYTITKKAGEEDKLFGSVTNSDIADLLKEEGFDIDKKKIIVEEPITVLGVYQVKIKLGHNIEAEIKIWVVKE